MKTDQLKRLKELEKENERLRRSVSDKTPITETWQWEFTT